MQICKGLFLKENQLEDEEPHLNIFINRPKSQFDQITGYTRYKEKHKSGERRPALRNYIHKALAR
jgi:hypothetical protein